jgi:hypothetical protein
MVLGMTGTGEFNHGLHGWTRKKGRKPMAERRPKTENRKQACFAEAFPVRASDLGFLSEFGFRISDFEN